MRYLDLPEDGEVAIYDLFPSKKHFLEFLEYANEVVCARKYLDPEHHRIGISVSITVYPDFEPPFVKGGKV